MGLRAIIASSATSSAYRTVANTGVTVASGIVSAAAVCVASRANTEDAIDACVGQVVPTRRPTNAFTGRSGGCSPPVIRSFPRSSRCLVFLLRRGEGAIAGEGVLGEAFPHESVDGGDDKQR